MSEHFLIVGGGQAGAQAAQTLRQKGFGGRITLVGEEAYPPYQRPPLSKKYLAGELERERLYLRPLGFYRDKGVQLELGVGVERLEPSSRQVVLADGRSLGYDRLLLATGSGVRKLSLPGSDLNGVHYLRTIADVDMIAERLRPGKRLVIVGAGYIGLEVAAVALKRGLDVTVLEALERVMSRVVCAEVSAFYHAYHTDRGVKIHCNVQAARFHGERAVEAVEGCAGRRFDCDLVIVGIGIEPRVELARAAGLACDNGVCVDRFARTEDPAIVAAGDCTNHPSALLGRRVRLESVHNAIEQAKTAVSSMLGERTAYTDVPWFWSDQYDLKLQIAGLSQGYDRIVVRGQPARARFAVFYFSEGRLTAVDAINSPREFMTAKKLIAARSRLPPEAFADQEIDLAELAK